MKMNLKPSKELEMVTEYLHPLNADALSEFESSCELPRCNGLILKRFSISCDPEARAG